MHFRMFKNKNILAKFIYSEKATKFCEIFTLLLTTVHRVKSKVKISQNFVTFLEYMNFKYLQLKFDGMSDIYIIDGVEGLDF